MWFILCLCSSHKRSKLLRWFKAFFPATDAEARMMLSASLFSKEQGMLVKSKKVAKTWAIFNFNVTFVFLPTRHHQWTAPYAQIATHRRSLIVPCSFYPHYPSLTGILHLHFLLLRLYITSLYILPHHVDSCRQQHYSVPDIATTYIILSYYYYSLSSVIQLFLIIDLLRLFFTFDLVVFFAWKLSTSYTETTQTRYNVVCSYNERDTTLFAFC